MFHFPYTAPTSFATCQSDSISLKFTMYHKVVFIKNFVPFRTLFHPLKIAIFCRIVPRLYSSKRRISKKIVPLQTLFHALKIAIFCRIVPRLNSSKLRISKKLYPSKRCFTLYKSPFSVASSPDQNPKIRKRWPILPQ